MYDQYFPWMRRLLAKARWFILLLLVSTVAFGQEKTTPLPQGSSLPGLAGLPFGLNGPGFLELGGGYSTLSNNLPTWRDAYLRGVMSTGKNSFDGETTRQERYGDTGWFFGLGWTRVLSENWYTDLHFGSSTVSGFFLPKARVDGFLNRKLLARKQLVMTGGFGYDRSKTVNSAYRVQVNGTYYFEHPFVLQGGVTWTRANPGAIVARSQWAAITQGHEKEHYISLRAEIGREGYELIGPQTALFDFVVHNYSLNYRQWLGVNWGFNAALEHEGNLSFKRNGGTVGIFMDF
jgi:YaiO family outer membrane protein